MRKSTLFLILFSLAGMAGGLPFSIVEVNYALNPPWYSDPFWNWTLAVLAVIIFVVSLAMFVVTFKMARAERWLRQHGYDESGQKVLTK